MWSRIENLPSNLKRRLGSKWDQISGLASLGWPSSIKYPLMRWSSLSDESVFWIHPRSIIHPLFIRPNSSDLDVFDQIFINREYRCLDRMAEVRLIIDCGANVGYSSAYFLSQHPHSRIIAVEPDPENFDMLRRNLDLYAGRVTLINAAVWSHCTRLALCASRYRDGREWTRQVRAFRPGDKAIEGVDLGTLLASSGEDHISILKIDIEGAEAVIFSENCESWLSKVEAIVIELHDDSVFGNATKVFFNAIEDLDFEISHKCQLTICRKRRSREYDGR
jgi:FkbM family methyltransferase